MRVGWQVHRQHFATGQQVLALALSQAAVQVWVPKSRLLIVVHHSSPHKQNVTVIISP